MLNIQSITELLSLGLSLVAMLAANASLRDKEKNRVQILERKIMMENLLNKHEEDVNKDLNNMGGKINKIESELQLIEYQIKEILKKHG